MFSRITKSNTPQIHPKKPTIIKTPLRSDCIPPSWKTMLYHEWDNGANKNSFYCRAYISNGETNATENVHSVVVVSRSSASCKGRIDNTVMVNWIRKPWNTVWNCEKAEDEKALDGELNKEIWEWKLQRIICLATKVEELFGRVWDERDYRWHLDGAEFLCNE